MLPHGFRQVTVCSETSETMVRFHAMVKQPHWCCVLHQCKKMLDSYTSGRKYVFDHCGSVNLNRINEHSLKCLCDGEACFVLQVWYPTQSTCSCWLFWPVSYRPRMTYSGNSPPFQWHALEPASSHAYTAHLTSSGSCPLAKWFATENKNVCLLDKFSQCQLDS